MTSENKIEPGPFNYPIDVFAGEAVGRAGKEWQQITGLKKTTVLKLRVIWGTGMKNYRGASPIITSPINKLWGVIQ